LENLANRDSQGLFHKEWIMRELLRFFPAPASILASLIILAFPAQSKAQIGFSQSAWLYGTEVVAFNATEDEASVKLVVNNRDFKGVLGSGEHKGVRFGSGLFIFYPTYGYYEAVISAKVCSSSLKTTFISPPPSWAMNTGVLANLALTQDYLDTNPGERELRFRVEEIKRSLRDRLGHKEMKSELDYWFRSVKRSGITFDGVTCEGPAIQGVRIPIYDNSYNNTTRTLAVYIRGSRKTGYRVEGPLYTAY
jgi:hypothetical protein